MTAIVVASTRMESCCVVQNSITVYVMLVVGTSTGFENLIIFGMLVVFWRFYEYNPSYDLPYENDFCYDSCSGPSSFSPPWKACHFWDLGWQGGRGG